MISAVVLTKNEEKNIRECFETLCWCDEIIVVDDYSSDQTIDQIKNFMNRHAEFISASRILNQVQDDEVKVRIFKRHLNRDFARQRNYGLEKAGGDWVLFVDADERISTALENEIKTQISQPARFWTGSSTVLSSPPKGQNDETSGFYIKRKDYLFGRWLEYGETAKIKLLRLAKKDAGSWRRPVHEVWQVSGKVGELKNPLLHYPHQTVGEFLEDINFYTSLNAKVFYNEGVKASAWQIIVYPAAKFLKNYFWRLGFLDGMSGYLMAIFMSFHSFLTRAKLWTLWKEKK